MQPSMQHQAMGYDRVSTMFSPDGRLLQVEYAKKTVRQGTSTIGVVCKDGVLLLADKRIIDKLIVGKSVEKVFQIDDHIAASASGILSDGRILIEKAQVLAQQHRVTYDEPIDVHSVVKDMCNLKQAYTQYGGARPFGVSLLVAGVDGEAKLFVTDPTGIYFEYKATAIGEAEDEIKNILEKQYKETMSLDEGLRLAVGALKTVLGKEFNLDRIDGCYVPLSTKKFKRLTKDDIKKIAK
ncbi:MAG: archaeal proteasome endopeptidase complex subunit alpha [Nanoarchaeota archaeon]|nr:archaeal proteasome endopeptidase complex subunit alpha [Nanoarchaeota archaeon]